MEPCRASLPLQLLLSLHRCLLPAFLLLEGAAFVFKVYTLPYPTGSVVSEVLLFLFLAAIEYGRLECGERGNLLRSSGHALASVVLHAPALVVVCYALLWQTYVLRAEAVLLVCVCVLHALQCVLAVLLLLSVSAAGR